MNNSATKPELISVPPQETDFSLSELKQILFRRWKPALAVGVTVFAGIVISKTLQTPLYQSITLILLENPKTQESAPVAPTDFQRVNSISTLKDLSTQILVLKSKSLISKAIAEYPDTFQGLSTARVTKSLFLSIQVVNNIPTDVLTVSFIDESPVRTKAILDALGKVYVKYSLDKQRSQAANAIAFIDEQLPEARLELNIAAHEMRRFRQENNLVDPNIYASEASGFRQSLEQQSKKTEIALQAAKSRHEELSFQLEALGQNPKTILASSILSQDGVYKKLAIQLSKLETDYFLGSTEFKDTYPVMQYLKAKQKELQGLLRERAKKVLGDTVSQTILDQAIITSTETIANTDSTTTTDNSEIYSQGGILQSLGNQLLEARNEIAILQSQIDGTSKAKAKVEDSFQDIPELQETFAELQRQLELKSKSVNYLLQRRQQLQIALAEETAPWQVLDEPYLPVEPISPNIKRALIIALFAGGFFGVVTAWMLHKLDNRIKLIDEIKQITHLPLIGVIPKSLETRVILGQETEISSLRGYSYRYSSFTEAFRTITMNLSYMIVKSGKIKSLVMTSSTSSEGKSTISHNLALVLADLRFRVLLVDADLRKPKIHRLSQLSNEKGLTEAITTDQPWSEIVKSNVIANLDIMTSGLSVPNPIAILGSHKMTQLLQEWEAAYDYVLIDTPPIGVMADAQSLVHQLDTVLLVAGIDRATQKSLSHTLEILQGCNCNIAGFIANFVEQDLDYHSYSYHSHYYNQPSNGNDNNNGANSNEQEGVINSIMQQFRRR